MTPLQLPLAIFHRFKELKDRADYLYSFNPCYPFNEGLCENAHVSLDSYLSSTNGISFVIVAL